MSSSLLRHFGVELHELVLKTIQAQAETNVPNKNLA